MPVSASSSTGRPAATSAGKSARGKAADKNSNKGKTPEQIAIEKKNKRVNLAFRQKVAALTKELKAKEKTVNSLSRNFGNQSITFRVTEDLETGERNYFECWGEAKNIPRSLRTKRSVGEMLGDDADDVEEEEEANDEEGGADQEDAEMWSDEEVDVAAAAAKQKKQKAKAKKAPAPGPAASASASAAKKQKKSAAATAGDRDSTDARRTARVPSKNASTASSRTPRPASTSSSASRREPLIREDEEENHVTQNDDGAAHRLDGYNLRTSTRAASDDLNSLSDRMNNFEIKSETGSESTRVFSRDSSLADPVPSTSQLF